jgi:hypothetical protein
MSKFKCVRFRGPFDLGAPAANNHFNKQPMIEPMKTKRILTGPRAPLMLLLVLAMQPASTRAAGSLTPPGAPAPTMKTLQEMEPRTLIAAAPFTISAPGSYYLSTNLTVASGSAIMISASGVTLDLNGFTLSSTFSSAAGSAIYINSGYQGVAICNGHIVSGVTNNGGSYVGPGFANGIYGPSNANVRVSHVLVSGCLNRGIYLSDDSSSVVECVVRVAGQVGIQASVVTSCEATDCGVHGIYGTQVSDSYSQSLNCGIYAITAVNCRGVGAAGCGIAASTALNCYGHSSGYIGLQANRTAGNSSGSTDSPNSYGIYGYDLTGCYGSGGGYAVYALGTAHGCYGSSSNGFGIYARSAENCAGYSYAQGGSFESPFAGVSADAANNCYGYSSSTNVYVYGMDANSANNCQGTARYGVGCYVSGTADNCFGVSTNSAGIAASVANNCSGTSVNGVGVQAYAANNCYGTSSTNTGLSADTANNCSARTATGKYGIDAICVSNSRGDVVGGASTNSCGINAAIANNCYGYSNSSGSYTFGIFATTVANSYGHTTGLSYHGHGIDATRMAIGCYGYSGGAGGIGLNAFIGQSCSGSGFTPISLSHNWNSF